MKQEISYKYEEREMLSEERENAMWLEQLAAESRIRNQRKKQDEENNTVTDVN
tara:strand:- start:52 stop:210 length:159 start_codon:yes stop_codon:yes gene_type:complete